MPVSINLVDDNDSYVRFSENRIAANQRFQNSVVEDFEERKEAPMAAIDPSNFSHSQRSARNGGDFAKSESLMSSQNYNAAAQ